MTYRVLDPPEVWRLVRVIKVVDGDTFDAVLRRVLVDEAVLVLDARSRLIEHREKEVDARVRVSRVDTPERGEPGYRAAGADLAFWLGRHAGEAVEVRAYVDDTFDRLVSDIYPVADPSAGLTGYMLSAANGGAGWPAWVGR